MNPKNKFSKLSVLVVVVIGGIALGLSAQAQSFYSGSFLTGQDALLTTASTNAYGGSITYTKYSSTWGAAYSTNATTANATNTSAIIDLPLWANRDGSTATANVSVHLVGTNATTGTNIVTFTFAAVPRAPGGTVATEGVDRWSFTVTGNGTTDVVLATNLPAAIFQGSAAIRLVSFGTPGAGTTLTVRSVALNGYRP